MGNTKELVKALKEIREAFNWTWENMGTPHTSDHFNIPANGVEAVNRLIEALSQPGEVNEGVEKAAEKLAYAAQELIYDIRNKPNDTRYTIHTKKTQEAIDNYKAEIASIQWQSQQSAGIPDLSNTDWMTKDQKATFANAISPKQDAGIEEDQEKKDEEKDLFAMAFAVWLYGAEGQMYKSTGLSMYKLLQTYKDRPFINTFNPENQ